MTNNIDHIYDYTATFEDGSVITYNRGEEDTPQLAETGNRFTDVLKKSEDTKLISFVLHNEEKSIGVDLRDGHFELNGIPFFQHRPDLERYQDFRIIYYRTVVRQMNQETMEQIDAHISQYAVGWQTTVGEGDNARNVKRELIVP